MRFQPPSSTVWTIVLLALGFVSNRYLGCGTNLVAFAVVATITLGARRGTFVALAVWLESQVLGFGVFGYPHAPSTIAWGIALGAATLVAATVARACASRGTLVAFAAAFATYEVALACFAIAVREGLGGFSPAIVLELLVDNAATTAVAFVAYALVALATPLVRGAGAERRA